MTTKKTKLTAEKFNEIKLSGVAQADDFVDIHIDVPEDMSEFFDKHHKTLLPRILPLLVVMNLTGKFAFRVISPSMVNAMPLLSAKANRTMHH